MYLTLLFTTLLALNGIAGTEVRRMAPQFYRVSSEELEISENQSKFVFKLYNIDQADQSAKIKYSVDGKESKAKLDQGNFSIVTKPGKHKFIIFISSNYEELYSDSLEIREGYQDTYNVRAIPSLIEVMDDKPVIYLYPEEKTNVNVVVEPKGEMTMTYPEYHNGWNVTANVDGSIECNGETYNYLFWEAKREMERKEIAKNGGYIVQKENVVVFLEKQLKEAGFSSKERADFITYWGPRMLQFDEVFVAFIQNENCDQFATLSISPQPENVNRFYMTWGEYTSGIILAPEPVVKMNRSGFDALEWGGQQIILEEISESL